MKQVNLPKGASITMSRDDYARASGGGVWGWVLGILIICALAGVGVNGSNDTPDKTPSKSPTPAATATR